MSETKVFNVPDGNNSINPALMMALSQNGGFGNGMAWMWPMFMFMMYPWLFNGGFGGFGGFGGAGNIINGYMPSNSTYYLYTGGPYYTMTPQTESNYERMMAIIGATGGINYYMASENRGIRPVISLKLGVEFEEDGDGTPTNPYVVKYN